MRLLQNVRRSATERRAASKPLSVVPLLATRRSANAGRSFERMSQHDGAHWHLVSPQRRTGHRPPLSGMRGNPELPGRCRRLPRRLHATPTVVRTGTDRNAARRDRRRHRLTPCAPGSDPGRYLSAFIRPRTSPRSFSARFLERRANPMAAI